MKLYDLPRNSYFRLLADDKVPPAAPAVVLGEVYWFGHVDGMYSFCKGHDGRIVHVVAWAEVEPVPGHPTENPREVPK